MNNFNHYFLSSITNNQNIKITLVYIKIPWSITKSNIKIPKLNLIRLGFTSLWAWIQEGGDGVWYLWELWVWLVVDGVVAGWLAVAGSGGCSGWQQGLALGSGETKRKREESALGFLCLSCLLGCNWKEYTWMKFHPQK